MEYDYNEMLNELKKWAPPSNSKSPPGFRMGNRKDNCANCAYYFRSYTDRDSGECLSYRVKVPKEAVCNGFVSSES